MHQLISAGEPLVRQVALAMRAKTLQIIWHEKQPVFSVDFHPDGYLATGGADREIKVNALISLHYTLSIHYA